jgi:hypothetical protein
VRAEVQILTVHDMGPDLILALDSVTLVVMARCYKSPANKWLVGAPAARKLAAAPDPLLAKVGGFVLGLQNGYSI